MKTIIVLFLMMWLVPGVWGQKVEYQYDAAGNRKLRKVITLQASPSMSQSAATDSDQQAETPASPPVPETYEDLLGERKVVIYPNPTRGMIRIEFQGQSPAKDARLLLYNMQGKLLRQAGKVEPSNTLDLTPYPAGMYILQMIEGKARSEWKIVKE